MKKIVLLISVVILSLGCLTLNPTAQPTPEPATESVATTNPTQPIEAQAGETFTIVIDANPTTGYHWEFVSELDANVLEFVSRDYIADQPVKPGSGGVDVWTFRAVSAGQAQVSLGSYPPDLDATEPWQTVTFDITVQD